MCGFASPQKCPDREVLLRESKIHIRHLRRPSLISCCHSWLCSFRNEPPDACLSLRLAVLPEGSVGGWGGGVGSSLIPLHPCSPPPTLLPALWYLLTQPGVSLVFSGTDHLLGGPGWQLSLTISSDSSSRSPVLFPRSLLKSLVHLKFSSSKLFLILQNSSVLFFDAFTSLGIQVGEPGYQPSWNWHLKAVFEKIAFGLYVFKGGIYHIHPYIRIYINICMI